MSVAAGQNNQAHSVQLSLSGSSDVLGSVLFTESQSSNNSQGSFSGVALKNVSMDSLIGAFESTVSANTLFAAVYKRGFFGLTLCSDCDRVHPSRFGAC